MIESKEPYVFSAEKEQQKKKKKKNSQVRITRDESVNREENIVEVNPTAVSREGDVTINVFNAPVTINTVEKVVDVNYLLNVRETPNGKILRTIKNGEKVEVIEDLGEWSKLTDGSYVMSKFLK